MPEAIITAVVARLEDEDDLETAITEEFVHMSNQLPIGDVKSNDKVLNGRTSLSWAAAEGDEATVKLLLDRGVGIKTRDGNGMTALSQAAAEGRDAILQLLLDKGADVETKNGNDG